MFFKAIQEQISKHKGENTKRSVIQTQRMLLFQELNHHVSWPDFIHSRRQGRQMHLIAEIAGKKYRILTANLIVQYQRLW